MEESCNKEERRMSVPITIKTKPSQSACFISHFVSIQGDISLLKYVFEICSSTDSLNQLGGMVMERYARSKW